jgi:hypothetical protein
MKEKIYKNVCALKLSRGRNINIIALSKLPVVIA